MNELIDAITELNYTMQDISRQLEHIRDELYVGTLPMEDRNTYRKRQLERLMKEIEAV